MSSPERAERIRKALEEGKIVVIAGNVKRFRPEEQRGIHFEELVVRG